MQHDQITLFKSVKYAACTVAALAVTGIATLMYIARDKNEDIAGIVAPALLLTILSIIVAIAAATLQKRSTGCGQLQNKK